MKKVALVFVVAVIVPSLVLAWLSFRSLRDQQFLLQRQRSLLYQGIADDLGKEVANTIYDHERSLAGKVSGMLRNRTPLQLAISFDHELREEWPLAKVGFIVTTAGKILSPSPYDRPEAKLFLTENSRFLANRESAEVYLNPKQALMAASAASPETPVATVDTALESKKFGGKTSQPRSVLPQSSKSGPGEDPQFSKVSASEAEFRQLIGDETEGTIARFVDNKLDLLLWCRPSLADGADSSKQTAARDRFVFGAQLSLPQVVDGLRPKLQIAESSLRADICAALLDDTARPVAVSHPGFTTDWKHPFVASEIGEVLPHWEIAVYLLNPTKLRQSAQTLRLVLGLLIAVLLTAIAVGSWLIVRDLDRQLTLARQKTDFVSNVSHELKTPLTSIRMFSDLLAEGRVSDPEKRRAYSAIISAETARLTRLINNVLDFARIERGEKKYEFHQCDIVNLVHETVASYRPQLEANGFQVSCSLPDGPILVEADRDSLSQVIVNLLSNAEKYSPDRKEISVSVTNHDTPQPQVEICIEDRGSGVPAGCEEKIFEKFYRAHDSLSSGIQGSGLGLTLARQIAHAHGGEVLYRPRPGGGSCFTVSLPLTSAIAQASL